MTSVELLVENLLLNKLTISSVESLTAGLFLSTIANVPGTSKVIRGGLITYQEQTKIKLAKIDKKIIDKYTVVSQEVALEMAKNGAKILQTDICVSFTGNAGPTKDKGNKPVGDVYIGIVIPYANFEKVLFKNFSGTRNQIRKKCVSYLVNYLNKNIFKHNSSFLRSKK